MKRNVIGFFVISLCLSSVTSCNTIPASCRYADPFIGSGGFGHCSPSAATPFGMIQTGPQTGLWGWDYTAGYQYADTLIYGFSQTRLNGTGCPDSGDLLVLPFTGNITGEKYAGRISKSSETAGPGFYSVYLPDFDIKAELTATEHVACHKYDYHGQSECKLLIDFQNVISPGLSALYRSVMDSEQRMESPYVITGYAHINRWVERTYHYVIEFNQPIVSKSVLPPRDRQVRAPRWILNFGKADHGFLQMKIAMSTTDVAHARRNLINEIPGWNFHAVRLAARKSWSDLLGRIEIQGTAEQKRCFYTSMYHLFLQPNNIADSGSPVRYSTLSLWDTYRAAHPLYTLLAPEFVDGFINSMLAQFEENGFLPIWSLWGKENYCMIGNHSVPVIVDAYLKGFRGYDTEKAYEAIKTSLTANLPKTNSEILDRYGYYPFDLIPNESVSRTLECGYDDYCACLMAGKLGKEKDVSYFKKRSRSYKKLFDSSTGFMRGRDLKGNWREPFDVFTLSHDSSCGGDYTEGNAWHYVWYVPHETDELIHLLGGEERFVARLDSLFTLDTRMTNDGFSGDVSGLIGLYAHGNEPCHHVAYLYALAGHPERTQRLVNYIVNTKYSSAPDGLCGNDDCGQMSAWYVFSVLGFYPVNPCGGEYVLGAPQLPSAKIRLPSGKVFNIIAKNYSPENIYVEKIELDGAIHTSPVLRHDRILQGGNLVFHMTDKPSAYREIVNE